MENRIQQAEGRKLIRLGLILFLLGLITGLFIPVFQNPRMGLSSHLEGSLNGMLLIIFGLVWHRLVLSAKLIRAAFWLAITGTYFNWFTTLLAAAWGAGSKMMPIAGADMNGSETQEAIIKAGLIILTLAILSVTVILIAGMRERKGIQSS